MERTAVTSVALARNPRLSGATSPEALRSTGPLAAVPTPSGPAPRPEPCALPPTRALCRSVPACVRGGSLPARKPCDSSLTRVSYGSARTRALWALALARVPSGSASTRVACPSSAWALPRSSLVAGAPRRPVPWRPSAPWSSAPRPAVTASAPGRRPAPATASSPSAREGVTVIALRPPRRRPAPTTRRDRREPRSVRSRGRRCRRTRSRPAARSAGRMRRARSRGRAGRAAGRGRACAARTPAGPASSRPARAVPAAPARLSTSKYMLCGERSGWRRKPAPAPSVSLPDDSASEACPSRWSGKPFSPTPVSGWSRHMSTAAAHIV